MLADGWREQHALRWLPAAVAFLHSPPPAVEESALQARAHPAWRRIKFDELLAQQLALRRLSLARRRQGAPVLAVAGELARRLPAALPFALTLSLIHI